MLAARKASIGAACAVSRARPVLAMAAVAPRPMPARTAFGAVQAPQRLMVVEGCTVPRMVMCYDSYGDAAVEPEPSNRLFVGNLSWDTDRDGLGEHFQTCPGFVSARVAFDMDRQRSRGFGFIEFDSIESAESALEAMAETELDGRNLLVRRSTSSPRERPPRREFQQRGDRYGGGEEREFRPRQQQQPRDPDTTLFVGNLPWSMRWQQVKDVFADVGPVEFVDIPQKDGRSRGFAIVCMGNPEAAQQAVDSLNGQDVEGRPLTVRRYEQRERSYVEPTFG